MQVNAMVVLVWLLSWMLGASVDVQFYIVLALGMAVTFGFYKVMKIQQNGGLLDRGIRGRFSDPLLFVVRDAWDSGEADA